MREEIAISLGVKYPQLYNLPSPKPSEILLKGATYGMDLYQMGEMDSKKFQQLIFAMNKPEPKYIILETTESDKTDPSYTFLGLCSNSGRVEYVLDQRTHIWYLNNGTGELIFPQNSVKQILSPDHAHNYFRITITSAQLPEQSLLNPSIMAELFPRIPLDTLARMDSRRGVKVEFDNKDGYAHFSLRALRAEGYIELVFNKSEPDPKTGLVRARCIYADAPDLDYELTYRDGRQLVIQHVASIGLDGSFYNGIEGKNGTSFLYSLDREGNIGIMSGDESDYPACKQALIAGIKQCNAVFTEGFTVAEKHANDKPPQ